MESTRNAETQNPGPGWVESLLLWPLLLGGSLVLLAHVGWEAFRRPGTTLPGGQPA